MILIPIFAFGLTLSSAQSLGSVNSQQIKSDNEVRAQLLESPTNRFVESKAGRFEYTNPRDSDVQCGEPLSVSEKISQQYDSKNHGDLTLFHLQILASTGHGVAKTVLTSPGLVFKIHRIFAIRDRVHQIENQYFPKSLYTQESDESDAFRHYLFVIFLWREFGSDTTELVLKAHEYYQFDMSSMMDRFNNEMSLRDANTKLKTWPKNMPQYEFETRVKERALNLIQQGDLVVISSNQKTTPEPSTVFYQFSNQLLKFSLE